LLLVNPLASKNSKKAGTTGLILGKEGPRRRQDLLEGTGEPIDIEGERRMTPLELS
jgi:hypothetical protein